MRTSLDQSLAFHETALRLRAQRQQLLASNIANADTPNYKARDFDFSQALKTAIGGGTASLRPSLATTSPKHIAAPSSNGLGTAATGVQYRTVQQASVDSNTVDMDLERNQFVDNAVRYEASLTMVSGQVKSLLTAIQG
jgi:flagellar basal-body rod protein FlgB